MGIFNSFENMFESQEDVEIPEFLRRDDDKPDEYEDLKNINISNKEIKLLCMDHVGKDIVEKIKHLGNDEVECILISEGRLDLDDSSADTKIFIDRRKKISDYYDVIDDIIDNSSLIIQVMDLGTYTSTNLTDRINYLCKKRNKKIAYIGVSPFSFLDSATIKSAEKQIEELKNDNILILNNQELFEKHAKNLKLEEALAERNKLIINAIDYLIGKKNTSDIRTF